MKPEHAALCERLKRSCYCDPKTWFHCDQCKTVYAIESLSAELDSARKDAKAGWEAFYKLRKSVAQEKYPGLTGEVRAAIAREKGSERDKD